MAKRKIAKISQTSLAAFKAHRSRAVLALKATRSPKVKAEIKARIASYDEKLAGLAVANA